MSDASTRVDPFVELANYQLHDRRGIDRMEFLPQLRGRRQAELYREMAENDALIGAILFAVEMILRRVEWEVEPGKTGDEVTPEDIRRADFLNTCKLDMSASWENTISDILTMLPFGFSYVEIVYKHRADAAITAPAEQRTNYPDGKIGWRKLVLVPQATIEDWELDDHGGVQAAIQGGAYGLGRVCIPIEKALLFRTSQRSPRGISVLRRVVESWYFRKRIREIEGIGIERDLAGLPVFTLDVDTMSNSSRLAEYQKVVRNLRRDEQEGVILPGVVDDAGELRPTAKLELLTTGGARQFNTSEIINRYSREIAVALLQDIVLLGHEKVGTQALASEKRDLSDTALQAWLNDIAAVLNTHAVPRLFALNGESLENLPQLVPGELRPTDVNEFAEALQAVASSGFVFTGDMDVEAEVRRRLGLPPMLPEDQAARTPPPDEESEPDKQPERPERSDNEQIPD